MDRSHFLSALQFDVWAFQECEAKPDIGANYIEALQSVNNPKKYLVIASQHRLFDAFLPETGNCIACIVDAPTPFVFGNIWSFDPIPKRGRYQKYIESSQIMMDRVIGYAGDLRLPLVVGGDFNMSLGHELTAKARNLQQSLYREWASAGLTSAYHEAMAVDFGEEQEMTVTGKSGPSRWAYHIDYIWYDRGAFTLETCKLYPQMKSDHTPVTAVFS